MCFCLVVAFFILLSFVCYFFFVLCFFFVFWFYFVIVFYCYPNVCIAKPSTLKYNDYDGKTQMGSFFFLLNFFFYQGYDKSIFISFIELNLNKISIHLMSYMYEYNVQFVFIWFSFSSSQFFYNLVYNVSTLIQY